MTCFLASYPMFCFAEVPSSKQLQNIPVAAENAAPTPQHSSSDTPRARVTSIRASCKLPPQPTAIKVIDAYWTRGVENERIVDGKAKHYVELNLVVRTANFMPGECVEIVVRAQDNDDVAENIEKIVLRGSVDGEGVAYFMTPLKHYTLNLFSDKE